MQSKNKNAKPIGVKMHPIALLSIVDHHERAVGNKKKKRALGALLGENVNGVFEITNSYALPFTEKEGQGIYVLDHNYHEIMFAMFKKINIKEKFLGWYTTGTTFKKNDLEINEIFSEYTKDPVLIVVDVKGKNSLELPTKAFVSERIVDKRGYLVRGFKNIGCSVAAFEPEEVGVEHLVREIKDLNMDSLKSRLGDKVNSLLALERKVGVIRGYLDDVLEGKRKLDKDIVKILQEIMSKLPKVMNEDFKREMSCKLNDNYLNLYVSSIVKNVINVHNLLNNRIKGIEEVKNDKIVKETEGKKKEVEKVK